MKTRFWNRNINFYFSFENLAMTLSLGEAIESTHGSSTSCIFICSSCQQPSISNRNYDDKQLLTKAWTAAKAATIRMATIFPQFWLNNILKDLDHCSPVLRAEMSDKTACPGFIMGRQLGLSPISLQSTHNVLLKCCTVVTFLPALSTVRSRYIAYQFKGFLLLLAIPKPSLHHIFCEYFIKSPSCASNCALFSTFEGRGRGTVRSCRHLLGRAAVVLGQSQSHTTSQKCTFSRSFQMF